MTQAHEAMSRDLSARFEQEMLPHRAALLHTARAVTRRAERSAWAAMRDHGETVSPWPAKYLNRLSDLLFILARVANADHGDVLWRPGGDR